MRALFRRDRRQQSGRCETGRGGRADELVLWWWGEQEFAGLAGWLNDTIAIFEKEHPGVKVEAALQATENVFSDFPTASAAGNPPDLQCMWNGVYTMDWAWLGYTEPLNGYFTAKELDRMYSIPLTVFEGKAYRAGRYAFAFGWVYNKKMLKEPGVPDSMIPPKTFDDRRKVCQKVKDKGQEMLTKGEAAFTIAVGSIVPNIIKQLGDGNAGYMGTPKYGTGKLAGVPCMDIRGIGISSSSKNKKLAAEFIRTMHRKDRMSRLYTDLGAEAQRLLEEWKARNPDLARNYMKWMK